MAVMSSIQIKNPAADTLKTLTSAQSIIQLFAQVQADPTFVAGLGKQLAAAYALSSSEIAERDAAAQTVATAQAAVSTATAQLATVQQQITDAQTKSASDIKTAQAAFAAQQKASWDELRAERTSLNVLKSDLDDRETAVAQRETDATAAETKNTNDATANAAMKAKLDTFSQALADRLTKVTGLEQAALTM